MKIDHIALFCRDLEAMCQFFLDYFEAVSNEQYYYAQKMGDNLPFRRILSRLIKEKVNFI
jgi:catechol 2,3-dioxygenase-like lactoylglutathione lyase family enzyme